jgi:hypothetical protein
MIDAGVRHIVLAALLDDEHDVRWLANEVLSPFR